MFVNLLSNALKFCPRDSEVILYLKVLKTEALEDSPEFTHSIKFEIGIQDFGCGIPEEDIGKLFVDFGNLAVHAQANPTGRGLGLSICKAIVEAMDG